MSSRPSNVAELLREDDVERTCLDYLRAERIPFIPLNSKERLVAAHLGFKLPQGKCCDCIAFVPAGRPFRLPSGPLLVALYSVASDLYNRDRLNATIYGLFLDRPQLPGIGVPYVFEWKRPRGGRRTLAQTMFAELCEENGIPHAFVTSFEVLKDLVPPKEEK